MSLTIAYVTARRDPKIEWFHESLFRQLRDERGLAKEWLPEILVISLHDAEVIGYPKGHVFRPKPNVWQEEYRLTKEDWFAMANARNTALCLCETDYLAYVDDLSVLMPGWLGAVKRAMAGNYIVAGAYRKVKKLVVENGEVKSFEPFAEDVRLRLYERDFGPVKGGELYGCSCGFPLQALLEVGGWPEYCDGMGAEDYTLGIALSNRGNQIFYDKKMMTLESEEDHEREPALRKTDKGVSPNDKSHAALNLAKISWYFHNYYPGGMRALREYVLSKGTFPVVREPKHDWYDKQPIEEME